MPERSTFVSSPDYENPMDENAGNMYSVMVVASDGTNDGAMGVTVTRRGRERRT